LTTRAIPERLRIGAINKSPIFTFIVPIVFCVQGNELTAYDVARATGHADCVELLLQIGAKSAADCRGGKVGRETEQVVQQARDAAAREAEYWVTDELELRQRAAHLVAATINHAAASLTTSYCNDDRNNDHDRQQTSRKVAMNFIKRFSFMCQRIPIAISQCRVSVSDRLRGRRIGLIDLP